MKITTKILGITVNVALYCKNPYIKIDFGEHELSTTQKELIYNVFADCYQFVGGKKLYFEKRAPKLIEIILLNQFDTLYTLSLKYNLPAIAAYLLFNSLVKPREGEYKLYRYCADEENSKYYLTFLKSDAIIKNPSIFDVISFSGIIKYPDDLIDNNFNNFIRKRYSPDKKHFSNIFAHIKFQNPSFNTLTKHIGEFDIDYAIKELGLTDEQITSLKLLSKMVCC